MKKLNFKYAAQQLSKEQMKKVVGGEETGGGDGCCFVTTECDNPGNFDDVYGDAIINSNTCNISQSVKNNACQSIWSYSASDGSCYCWSGC